VLDFSKARHLKGTESQSLEFKMHTDNGSASWTYSTAKERTYDQVVALANDGLSQSEIARELEVNRSTVSRYFKKAESEGLINKQARGSR
jgi:DNA invertase Pin-like site-specific DNA recombinase